MTGIIILYRIKRIAVIKARINKSQGLNWVERKMAKVGGSKNRRRIALKMENNLYFLWQGKLRRKFGKLYRLDEDTISL